MAETPDEKYEQYPNTVLELCEPPCGRVDLRRPLGPAEHRLLAAAGLDVPFGVFTAENPCGENVEDEPSGARASAKSARNDSRTSILEERLRAAGRRFVRVDGVSPDGSYREKCVAVIVSRSEAVALAKEFDQLALFWFDGERFWLLPAEVDEPPRALPA
jgi:hypothetical protein